VRRIQQLHRFYLNSKQDDFADPTTEMRQAVPVDIPYFGAVSSLASSPNCHAQRQLAEPVTMRFNGCVTCGRQFLLPVFGMVRVN
jgi:predicted HicB family RNase H-like nuclease